MSKKPPSATAQTRWFSCTTRPDSKTLGGVLEWLENHTDNRSDGIERLQQFLGSHGAHHDFNQEAKVLRQVLQSDMAMYVIDAREPVLDKYRDELTILSWCAKPVMPVFNFTGGQLPESWTTMLARRNLHVFAGFDTVAFDFEGELRLWENLATMLPERSTLDRLTAMRRREWQRLDGEARREIADFLIDAAAFRQEVDENEDTATVLQTMQAEIRQLERQMQQRLFALYRFYHSEIDGGDWMPQAFRQDPFDSELLKQYGIRTGTGAATGALIGLGLDIATLGGSLGLGTAIGGFLGGILPNTRTISDKLAGRQTLHTDPETLTLLAARALDLLHVLQTRGHAAQSDIELHSRKVPWDAARTPARTQQSPQSLEMVVAQYAPPGNQPRRTQGICGEAWDTFSGQIMPSEACLYGKSDSNRDKARGLSEADLRQKTGSV